MSTTEHDDIAPADFDLDAWIDGTKPTERSCVIVGRGDLIAQAEELLRQYEALQRSEREASVTETTLGALEAEMEQVEQQIEASKAVWYLKALTPEEIRTAAKAAEKAAKRSGDPAKDENADYTAYQIAAAVVRVERADGSTAAGITGPQILKLKDRLGEAVVLQLFSTLQKAMSEDPSVSAPFSRKSSPGRAGPR
ncbi:MAG: hypothetical protein ACTHQ3_15775 [Motilibacteraceae bacterium]